MGLEASRGVVSVQQGDDAAQTFFTLDIASEFGESCDGCKPLH